MRIKTSATSANLGAGFDCLGLALNIYNIFDVKLSDKDLLLNVEECYNNEDNLFLQAYRKGIQYLGIDDHIEVSFNCEIPVARGLGSSSSLIVGGMTAASVLHGNALNKQEIFHLSAQMEGHPDNAAPCVFGGFCVSIIDSQGKFISRPLSFAESLKMTLFIPDFEVKTAQARSILPDVYPRTTAVSNAAKAIMSIKAFENGDLKLLKECNDEFHEPYRQTLIEEFNEVKEIYQNDTDGVLLISGSGSTCIGISDTYLSEKALNSIKELKHDWQIRKTVIENKGVEIINEQ